MQSIRAALVEAGLLPPAPLGDKGSSPCAAAAGVFSLNSSRRVLLMGQIMLYREQKTAKTLLMGQIMSHREHPG